MKDAFRGPMRLEPTIRWNAYPALLACGCFAAGIGGAEWLHLSFAAWAAGCLGGLACVVIGGRSRRSIVPQSRSSLSVLGIAVVLVTAGAVRHFSAASIASDHIARRLSEGRLEISGVIADVPVDLPWGSRFTLRIDPSSGARGLVQVTLHGSRGFSPEICDRVSVSGRVTGLPHVRNPGDWDYGRYLARRGVHVRLYADASDVSLRGRTRSGLSCVAHEVRAVMGKRLEAYVAGNDSRALLRALVLGDRRVLDPALRDRFARTGLLHLLAVSGLHVMVVGMLVYRLLRPLLMRLGIDWFVAELVRSIITALLLIAYAVLTGGTPSVVRAVVMALLFMAAGILQRTSRPLNTLGAAMLVLLVIRPSHLFEAGFQLSAVAVASIVTIRPQLHAWMPPPAGRIARYLHTATGVTISATLGTLPVVLHHFGRAALAGLLLNLPAVPMTSAVLTSGVAALAFGSIVDPAGVLIGASADLLGRMLLMTSAAGDQLLSWTLVRWKLEEPAALIALSLGVSALASWQFPRRRWRIAAAMLAVVVVHLWANIAEGAYRPRLDVLYLDVGHGDAAVARLPGGGSMLIDAGPRSLFTDAGSQVILPLLRRMNIRQLDLVVISHPDADHLGGLPSLLRSVRVRRVVRSGSVSRSSLYRETRQLLDSLGVVREVARAGDTLNVSGNVRLYVFHPRPTSSDRISNHSSVVMQLRYGSTAFLFMGDAPQEVERSILQPFGRLLPSNVLKVGHHGSRTSSMPSFLRKAADGDAVAVISASERNRFGLPDEEVVERLHRTGYTVRSTSAGAVWIRSDGKRIRVVDWMGTQ